MDLIQKVIAKVSQGSKAAKIPDFSSGDTVSVFVRVKEGEKERVQMYRGVVTKVQGAGASRAFTVRKMSAGVGVERTFPFRSPALEKVEVVSRGQVRRSRLFYLRKLEGKAAKIESELVSSGGSAGSVAPQSSVSEKSSSAEPQSEK